MLASQRHGSAVTNDEDDNEAQLRATPTVPPSVSSQVTSVLELDDTHQSLRAVSIPKVAENLARLVVLAGERAGRKLTVDKELVFGRSRGVGLQLDDPQVSRRHGRIALGPEGWFLEDLGSRNGTTLNGIPAAGQMVVQFGDRVQVGDSLLLFTHHDPLEEQILEQQKLESIGRLGTGIAHDFNNLLGAVHSSLDYVERMNQQRTLDDAEVQACLADIRTAAKRASEMTRRLLGFARRAHRSYEPVDVAALASEVLKLLRRSFDRSIEIDGVIDDGLMVTGDRSHLHQLLMNLCINARDALPNGGRLTVEVTLATRDDMAMLPYRDRDAYTLVIVEDDGVGMDTETQSRLFEPFFTTKREGHGAGLGLATVYEVVDAHGGQIIVESEVGSGTRFRIYLPTHLPAENAAVSPPTPDMKPRGLAQSGPTLRILLVDDEDVMRRSSARLLRQIGHHVVQATNGQEALDAYAAAEVKPDVVILDMDMPILRGDECYAKLREMDPDVNAIVVSGYIGKDLYGELYEQGIIAVLDKPFEIAVLQSVLAKIKVRESNLPPI